MSRTIMVTPPAVPVQVPDDATEAEITTILDLAIPGWTELTEVI